MWQTTLHRTGHLVRALLTDTTYFWYLASLVVVADAILTQAIVHLVAYTEIDWTTYMAQVDLYLSGMRNYSEIEGPTGPLVYPAGHVYIYHFLHYITDSGANIHLAQYIFSALYLTSLALSCAIYRRCKGVPNWLILLLPLSKRLHSIFVLRLFNDCWLVVLVQAAILAYQRGHDELGSLLFSAALSIKMSVLLYLPGLLVILFKRTGPLRTVWHLSIIILSQVLVALPFLLENPRAYLRASFDFKRVFLYKWTVNWRFVDEATFLSPSWARSLLIGHAAVLIMFGLRRWCRNDGGVWVVLKRGIQRPSRPTSIIPLTADDIATILFTSNLIGIIFARSLHYQFYSWYAQQLPLLMWKTRYPLLVKLAMIGGIEYAWNIFPSTRSSSVILVSANLGLLVGIWDSYSS